MSSGWKTLIIVITAFIIIGVYESSHGDKRGELMTVLVICGLLYLLMDGKPKDDK